MQQQRASLSDRKAVSTGRPQPRNHRCTANLVRLDRTTNQLTIIGRYSRREDALADQQWFTVNETTGIYLLGE